MCLKNLERAELPGHRKRRRAARTPRRYRDFLTPTAHIRARSETRWRTPYEGKVEGKMETGWKPVLRVQQRTSISTSLRLDRQRQQRGQGRVEGLKRKIGGRSQQRS